jgi:RNA ligase (TIGR02306 family)
MRQLATIRKIDQILPIEGADAIVLVKIDGWQCVAKKEEFKVGDLCVYFEIDSFLPLRPQYEHIRVRAYKKMGEHEGIRIKTIKLRGQLSQGLALPVSMFFDDFVDSDYDEGQELGEFFFLGNDITEFLGVQKYEPPVPTQLAGQVKGNFPSFIKKTDQERCQNLVRDIFVDNKDSRYEVTMKMDGTSFTAYTLNGQAGVCGRNWELKTDDPKNEYNSLVRMFIDSELGKVMLTFDRNFAIQGELMGPGIQKNRESLASHKLYVFDIFNIMTGEYLTPENRHTVMEELWNRGVNRDMVLHVPVIHENVSLDTLGLDTIDKLLAYSDGPSINHPVREGFVYKRLDGKFSFKAISNKYLLKEED